MKKCLVVLSLLFTIIINAQTPVLNLQDDTLFLLENNNLKLPNQQVLFTCPGNIVFKGEGTSYKNIILTLALDSFQQKKLANIYNAEGGISEFSIVESVIYFSINNQANPVATFVESEDSWAIYSNLNDSLLAYIPSTQVTNSQVFACFYALWNAKNMEETLKASLKTNVVEENEGLSIIYPVIPTGFLWVWDGKYLYPNGAIINDPRVWVFENNKLYPRNYPRTQEEWAWDGSSLKPYWGGNPQGQWSWQNGVLRQVWNNNHLNEYIIEDNVIRKRFGNFGDNEWEMEGDVPLPIITAIVLGILYR